ncbi:hypothetical protein I7I51_00385 [Histoplasma capsulatum]|uniref:Uncharacterized protein n=1 Tax=Ajellomyces capsulatus TaxID=5037 RepID=A0A8A1M9U7_AJECA|nr:predicted protein [Histoplasma mississippiense (nom. inval.)]EDN08735.1 predicted protein [Histoplasma mississippiense (nom. inval.)]QSS63328.1 hypothetical protein I7I51_00385 [Histoplasma capsulatum]
MAENLPLGTRHRGAGIDDVLCWMLSCCLLSDITTCDLLLVKTPCQVVCYYWLPVSAQRSNILNSLLIKTIVKNGKNLDVKYATRTTAWARLLLAKNVQQDFVKAIEKADVPEGAASATLANNKISETEHPSESDSKDHFTTVYEDENGDHITTKHVYP